MITEQVDESQPVFKDTILLAPHRNDRILIYSSEREEVLEVQSVPGLHQALYSPKHGLLFGIPRMSLFIPVYKKNHTGEFARIASAKNSFFYGHGAISSDGNYICLSEIEQPSGDGFISIWRLDSLSLVKRIYTGGVSPHDCCYAENDTFIYVVNGGNIPNSWDLEFKNSFSFTIKEHGSLCKINIETEAVTCINQFDSQYGSVGHLCITNNVMCVTSAPSNLLDPGYIYIKDNLSPFTKTKFPTNIKQPRGQALSVSFDPAASIFAVTHPDAELMSFWNKHGDFIKVLPIHANGVQVPAPGYLLANTTQNARGILINTLTWDINILDNFYLGNGPHLTMIKYSS